MSSPENPPQHSSAGPAQVLSLGDATAIIVGLIVGAGIFGTPSIVAGAVQSPALLVAVWVAGGVFSVIGALCYAELATAFPSAGGEYHFIGRAYGRSLAFLYGWARMTVVVAGSIAVFAYLFGDYMSRVINLGPQSPAIWAALVVTVLTAVNYAGIREGKITQNFFTFLECGGLVLIVVAGLLLAPDPAPAAAAAGGAPWYMGAGIGSAMVFVLFTYGGWNDAAYISAEVRDRQRNMVRALLVSIGIVTLLYLLVNLAYLKGLGYEGMARSDAVAADLMKRVWGPAGEKIISVMIAIAALTSVNGSMIVGARSNYALGRDWPLLGFLGRWNEASGSPRTAMLVQGAIALALVVLGAFQNAGFKGLVEYSLPVFWGFFMLTGIALFILRVKEREAPRPFRVPGYPVVPATFVMVCAYLLYSSLVYHGKHALVGLGVLAVGALVLLIGNRGQATVSGPKEP
jgi:amino acid transporter